MPDLPRDTGAFVASVLHPTDFSTASESAFAHALAVALLNEARLTLLHVGDRYPSEHDWRRFPGVRETLVGWGLLESGSPRSAVFESLSVNISKITARSHDSPLAAILRYLDEDPTDLLVLATGGRTGLPRWLRPSVAERAARQSRTMTLFVPAKASGVVSLRTGEISLKHILVPVDFDPRPQPAVVCAAALARLTTGPVDITLLHVGGAAPVIETSAVNGCEWRRLAATGDPVEQILQISKRARVDLIVMATGGHHGILDVLRGSVTEQVLRRVSCPLLAVPAQ